MPDYAGSCHCGAVHYIVSADPVETTSCDCTLCTKKNARMIQVPHAALTLVSGAENLATYEWNTGVAKHHFCTRCGIYTFHSKRSAPDSYGVNVYTLDGFGPESVPHRLADGKTMSVV